MRRLAVAWVDWGGFVGVLLAQVLAVWRASAGVAWVSFVAGMALFGGRRGADGGSDDWLEFGRYSLRETLSFVLCPLLESSRNSEIGHMARWTSARLPIKCVF